MAKLKVGDFSFDIYPETASWSYAMKIQTFDTYEGRVVQLLACNVEGLSVDGYILPVVGEVERDNGGVKTDVASQWIGMKRFEENVRQVMYQHEKFGRPARLTFDGGEFPWDSDVFLTGYTDVRYEPDIPAARYTLKFDVHNADPGVTAAMGEHGLKNIPDGVGWVRSIYNTPGIDDWSKVKEAIGKIVDDAGTHDASKPADFYEYLKEQFSGAESESAGDGNEDNSFVSSAEKVVNGATTPIVSFLEKYGIVKSSKR